MTIPIQLQSILNQLKIESLDQLCSHNAEALAKNCDERQLNSLVDALRSYLGERKVLASRITEITNQHLPVEILGLPEYLQQSLDALEVKTVKEFIQRDAASQLTLSWSLRERMAVRARIFCLMLLSTKQLESLRQSITSKSSLNNTISAKVFPASNFPVKHSSSSQTKEPLTPIKTTKSFGGGYEAEHQFKHASSNETWVTTLLNGTDESSSGPFLHQPWLRDGMPKDFSQPLPTLEKCLIEDVCQLPIATSRRHEIWAGAQMKASERLQKIIYQLNDTSPKNVFAEIYKQLYTQWQHLETLCISEQLLLPNSRIWTNELLTVRKDFYGTPRSRFRHFIRTVEKSNCNQAVQEKIVNAAFDLLEMFCLLPDSALRYIRGHGQELNDNLPAVEKFNKWLESRNNLHADLTLLQEQGLVARNKLVSGYFRSVLKFARNYAEKEHCPEYYLDLVQEGAIGLISAAERYDYRSTGRFITYATSWIWQTTGRALGELSRSIRVPVHRLEQFKQLETTYQTCFEAGLENPPAEILCLTMGFLDEKEEREIRQHLVNGNALTKKIKENWDKAKSKTEQLLEYIEHPISLSVEIPADFIAPILDETQSITHYSLAEIIYDQSNYDQTDMVKANTRDIEYQDLKNLISKLLAGFPVRTQQIINLRFGLEDGQERTLEEVGRHFGLTRERIRQIEAMVIRKLNYPRAKRSLKKYLELETLEPPSWPEHLIEFINRKYGYWSKFDPLIPEPNQYWEWLDNLLEKLPALGWHQPKHGISRKIQVKNIVESLKSPAHYSDITELLNDSLEEGELDERHIYNILNSNEDTFILLGEGVFSLNTWERARQDQSKPILPFCPQPLPDLSNQSDTFFESILVANNSLKKNPLASEFLEFMLKWCGDETVQSNWFKQSILNAYYLVGLIPYTFHFEGEDPPLKSTLPPLELTELRKYCLQKLTDRLIAMPEFWWVIRQYQPGKPADFAGRFVEIHPFGLNDVINRLRVLAGLGAVQRLPYGRYRLTQFGATVAEELVKTPEFKDSEDTPSESNEVDLSILDLGLW